MICNSPFVFATKVIKDDNDEKTIMFPYFGKIKLSKRFVGRKSEIISSREPWAKVLEKKRERYDAKDKKSSRERSAASESN